MRLIIISLLLFAPLLYSKSFNNTILLREADNTLKLLTTRGEHLLKLPLKIKIITNVMLYPDNHLIISYKNPENRKKLAMINLPAGKTDILDYPADTGVKILRNFAYYLIDQQAVVVTEVYRNGRGNAYLLHNSKKVKFGNLKTFKKRAFLKAFNQKGASLFTRSIRKKRSEFHHLYYLPDYQTSKPVKIFHRESVIRADFINQNRDIIFLTSAGIKNNGKIFNLYNYTLKTKKLKKINTFKRNKTEGWFPEYYVFRDTKYIMYKNGGKINRIALTDKDFIVQNIETGEKTDFNIPRNQNINLDSLFSIDNSNNFNTRNYKYAYGTKIIGSKWLKFDVKTRMVTKEFFAIDPVTNQKVFSHRYTGSGGVGSQYIDQIEINDRFLK